MNKEYKKNEDIPVGGIMVRKNGKKYEVFRSNTGCCTGCAFYAIEPSYCKATRAVCMGAARKDRKPVIFIRRKDLEEKKGSL